MSKNIEKPMNRKDFEEKLIRMAQSNREFKKALVENSKNILEQIGVQIPEDIEIRVVEESAKLVYLVLPFNSDELTDEQLDSVAGGGNVWDDLKKVGDEVWDMILDYGDKWGRGAP